MGPVPLSERDRQALVAYHDGAASPEEEAHAQRLIATNREARSYFTQLSMVDDLLEQAVRERLTPESVRKLSGAPAAAPSRRFLSRRGLAVAALAAASFALAVAYPAYRAARTSSVPASDPLAIANREPRDPGLAYFSAAGARTAVAPNSPVVTGPTAGHLLLPDGSSIEVAPNSRLRLSAPDRVELTSGEMIARMRPAVSRSVTLGTPQGETRVGEGTFHIWTDGDSTAVASLSGSAEVQPAGDGGAVSLPAGALAWIEAQSVATSAGLPPVLRDQLGTSPGVLSELTNEVRQLATSATRTPKAGAAKPADTAALAWEPSGFLDLGSAKVSAPVEVRLISHRGGQRRVVGTTRVDADQTFRFTRIPEGHRSGERLVIEAVPASGLIARAFVDAGSQGAVHLEARKGHPVAFDVRDRRGRPIPTAEVRLREAHRSDEDVVLLAASAPGTLGGVAPSGLCFAEVHAPGYIPVRDIVIRPTDSGELRVSVRLNASPLTVSGQVEGDASTLAGAELLAPNGERVTVAADGRFSLTQQPTGNAGEMRLLGSHRVIPAPTNGSDGLQVRVAPRAWDPKPAALNPAVGTTADLLTDSEPGSKSRTVSGILRLRDGNPAIGVEVHAIDITGGFLGETRTDATGSFTLVDRPSRAISVVWVDLPGFELANLDLTSWLNPATGEVGIPRDQLPQRLELVFQPAPRHEFGLLSHDGEPRALTPVRVDYFTADGVFNPGGATVLTNEEGILLLPTLPESGLLALSVQDESLGFPTAVFDISEFGAAPPARTLWNLARPGDLRGRLMLNPADRAGRLQIAGAPRFFVEVQRDMGGQPAPAATIPWVAVDAAGMFRVPSLAPGLYRVRLRGERGASAWNSVEIAADRLAPILELSPASVQ